MTDRYIPREVLNEQIKWLGQVELVYLANIVSPARNPMTEKQKRAYKMMVGILGPYYRPNRVPWAAEVIVLINMVRRVQGYHALATYDVIVAAEQKLDWDDL